MKYTSYKKDYIITKDNSAYLKLSIEYEKGKESYVKIGKLKRGYYLYIRTYKKDGNTIIYGLYHDTTKNNIENGFILLKEVKKYSQKFHKKIFNLIEPELDELADALINKKNISFIIYKIQNKLQSSLDKRAA